MLKIAIFGIILAYTVYRTARIVFQMGYLDHTYNHSPGPCHPVAGTEHGSEDIDLFSDGLAFISTGLLVGGYHREGYSHDHSGILLFNFQTPDKGATKLSIIKSESFTNIVPHGISTWRDPSGFIYLYVINHLAEKDVVDKFLFVQNTKVLQHVKRFWDPNFKHLNDLVVVGEDQFYFTTYYLYSLELEYYFDLAWGSIGFYNGQISSVLISGLPSPNGIAVSSDHKNLYVAMGMTKQLWVYDRSSTNEINLRQMVELYASPDNVDVDETTGDIWIGLHYELHKTASHLKRPDLYVSPSKVFKLPVSNGNATSVTEVYSND